MIVSARAMAKIGIKGRRRRVLVPVVAIAVAIAASTWAAFSVLPHHGHMQTSERLVPSDMTAAKDRRESSSSFFAGSSCSGAVRENSQGTTNDARRYQMESSPWLIGYATVLAAVAASGADAISPKDEAPETEDARWDWIGKLKLPIFAGLWYFFNIQYNIQNKMLLKVFSASFAVSWIQLFAGVPIALAMWGLGMVRSPKVTKSDVLKLVPVGAAFAAGQVATVASLGAVAVSFTHVVKALEPALNAVASALVLGQVFHPLVYLSLTPVFLGVALASSSELSFTPFGFATAMASNFFFVARNVLATKFGSVGDMGEDSTTRKTNQLAVLTIVASVILFPVCLVVPGGLLSAPAAWAEAVTKVPSRKLMYMIGASGFHFFMYQLSSFWVLSQVQPITHSVLNTLKRVVIIVVSVLVFRNPVTLTGGLGTAIAIGGVLLYSVTKGYFSKKK